MHTIREHSGTLYGTLSGPNVFSLENPSVALNWSVILVTRLPVSEDAHGLDLISCVCVCGCVHLYVYVC